MLPLSIIGWDQQITLWLNSFHTPLTDSVWMLFSNTRIWFAAYFAVMVMLILRLGWKKGLTVVVGIILTIVLSDQLSSLVKDTVMRLRPCYTTLMLDGGLNWPLNRPNFFGFFSSHASNCFAFALTSWLGFRAGGGKCRIYGICVFIWATLVALSRVMMGAHYFGDILVGTLFGLALGLMMAGLTRAVLKKLD